MQREKLQIWQETLNNHPKGLVVNAAAVVGIGFILRDTAATWFSLWFAISIAYSIIRGGLYLTYRKALRACADETALALPSTLHNLSVLGSAGLWAALACFGIPEFSPAYQFAVIIVVSSLASGSTATLASLQSIGKIYILIMLVPACLSLLMVGETTLSTLGILGFIFAWVMLGSHENNFQLLIHSFALAREKEQLFKQVSEQNQQIVQANAELEETVNERTKELQHLAHHDSLTGLLNRRGLFDQLPALEAVRDHQLIVLFFDLDRFKQINDGLGHDWGDQLLQAVASRLRLLVDRVVADCVPHSYAACRWGGDEFVVCLVSDEQMLAKIQAACEILQSRLSEPYVLNGREFKIGNSVGVFVGMAGSLTEMGHAVSFADMAASEAKGQGRGRIVFFSQRLSDERRRHLLLSDCLSQAHSNGSLALHFQPIVAAQSQRLVAFEALLRWHCPSVGAVSPMEFIPIAEDTGHIHQIGLWVLRHAVQLIENLPPETGLRDNLKIAINTSIKQLIRADFAGEVLAVLNSSQITTSQLVIEVTESVFDEQHMREVLASLSRLHQAGIEIHLDDFGTGYSSLSRLREFPLDAIKIDRSFVMASDEKSLAVIEGAVVIARKFGLRVIAEGVETQAQLDKLKTLGVDELQGYFIGKPAADIKHFLEMNA
ncbi:EAL domain-containing protein [Undibacterium sp. LX40W]|uniref:EAL domain-containing protein n=1 Tax=Undibacterium nitidum TaxID=2762298 RepID=A0A923KNY3_9BURK|nr:MULTISPECIES: GGDEF domain-containing phosphodiesterase [Undibacterium]MBC3881178.1 EAL domain-containing protein [Undibacterium nitidum]MBC3890089.1 EAL domain-containing protein [Undibacterium sp. LX40W]